MSQIKPLSPSSQQQNISLEMAIAKLLDASIEEISQVLEQAPPDKTVKLVIAVGNTWQNKSD